MKTFPVMIVCLTLPLTAQVTKTLAPPIKVTLCTVLQNPAEYNGKRLVIHAQYMTDRIERSLLFDESCQDASVLPYLQEHAVGAAAFNDATWVRYPTHLKGSITATFTGTFHFAKKPEMCMILNKEICRRSFEIEKIEGLVLTMTPNEDKK
jgi:hypothetical protein